MVLVQFWFGSNNKGTSASLKSKHLLKIQEFRNISIDMIWTCLTGMKLSNV